MSAKQSNSQPGERTSKRKAAAQKVSSSAPASRSSSRVTKAGSGRTCGGNRKSVTGKASRGKLASSSKAARGAKPRKRQLARNSHPESSPEELVVHIADHQQRLKVDRVLFRRVVRQILEEYGFRRGQVTVAVVNDRAIQRLNRLFLQEDEPTDVLSFPLEKSSGSIEAEIIVSSDTAYRHAQDYGNDPFAELLLYVIHGTLHLVGFDDHRPADRARMRVQEKHYLRRFGYQVRMRPISSAR